MIRCVLRNRPYRDMARPLPDGVRVGDLARSLRAYLPTVGPLSGSRCKTSRRRPIGSESDSANMAPRCPAKMRRSVRILQMRRYQYRFSVEEEPISAAWYRANYMFSVAECVGVDGGGGPSFKFAKPLQTPNARVIRIAMFAISAIRKSIGLVAQSRP